WPRGSAILLQPFQGCPAKWSVGFQTFGTGNGTNSYTDPESFREGKDEDDGESVTLYLCMKSSEFGTYDWPAGDYCTIEYGDCPTGFSRGEIDYQTQSVTEWLAFCCRNDGFAGTEIDLPNSDPFYLFRHQGQCQKVKGMLTQEEFIFFDNNNHGFMGAFPYVITTTGLEIRFCYYYPTANLSVWPKGTAELPQPETGCPTSWETMVFTLHPETGGNTHHSLVSHLRGPITADTLDWYFCRKPTEYGPYRWPAGDYCVAGQSCPTGFGKGQIYLDTEDDMNTENKMLYVCCRNDGLASTAIDLPTSDPFYLFRYKGQCQEVKGLVVVEEFLYIDTEDFSNSNQLVGETPYVGSDGTDNVEIHFCYYHNT
ncbi:uncharacterized protein LOC110462713, partial [Mizuhopecten yessoensis]|uniref:uncharacterized protein LOC110462713 n=1 Tax=Mizuhopecten yessoensis TaxID=6573 RepID=UPI000B458597